jgi:hypothetical protein
VRSSALQKKSLFLQRTVQTPPEGRALIMTLMTGRFLMNHEAAEVHWDQQKGAVWLHLTGPEGIKNFILDEFGLKVESAATNGFNAWSSSARLLRFGALPPPLAARDRILRVSVYLTLAFCE